MSNEFLYFNRGEKVMLPRDIEEEELIRKDLVESFHNAHLDYFYPLDRDPLQDMEDKVIFSFDYTIGKNKTFSTVYEYLGQKFAFPYNNLAIPLELIFEIDRDKSEGKLPSINDQKGYLPQLQGFTRNISNNLKNEVQICSTKFKLISSSKGVKYSLERLEIIDADKYFNNPIGEAWIGRKQYDSSEDSDPYASLEEILHAT